MVLTKDISIKGTWDPSTILRLYNTTQYVFAFGPWPKACFSFGPPCPGVKGSGLGWRF